MFFLKLVRALYARAFRVGLIGLMAGGIFAFGHFMTPRPPDAMAEVYYDLGRALEGVPAYMKAVVDDGDVNEVYLNGNTLYYTQYSSSKNVGQLLDYYENLYKGETHPVADQATKDKLLKYVEDPADRAEHARRIEETERLLNERYVRLEGKKWGAFATIVTGKEGEADWAEDMGERIDKFGETGMVKDLGDPKIVVAFEDDANGGSQYLNVWPGEDFNRENLRPERRQDAPGYDIRDVPRPRGSFRLVTFGQQLVDADYSILIYRGQDSMNGVENHWIGEMQAEGWALSESFNDGRAMMDEEVPAPHALLFVKDNRETYVAMAESAENSVTSTVVVYNR